MDLSNGTHVNLNEFNESKGPNNNLDCNVPFVNYIRRQSISGFGPMKSYFHGMRRNKEDSPH